MKPIKFYRKKGGIIPYETSCWRSKCHIYLCASTVKRAVSIPRDVDTIYAVFHKTRRVHDFTIVDTNNLVRQYGLDRGFSLVVAARDALGRAYREGLRYVRIEYDEPRD